MPPLRYILPALTCLTLVACGSLVPTRSTDQAEVATPSSWKEASKGQNKKISSGWLSEFNSPEMTKLVNEALNNNPNLNAAAARLRAAKEGTVGAQADLLPTVNAGTGGSRSRIGNGDNESVSSSQITKTLGAGAISEMAGNFGISPDMLSGQLAQYLPDVVNKMTPDGEVNDNSGELLSSVLGMLK